jgi:plasmid stabilization system protein ParE
MTQNAQRAAVAMYGTRRFLLQRTRYHVCYVAGAEDVRVLAIWHAERGVGPPLRA